MSLAEFIRVNDINWIDTIWMAIWILGILITIISIVVTSTWIMAVNHFKSKIMPDFYDGKLRIAQTKYKETSSENVLFKQENMVLHDRIIVMKSGWEGMKAKNEQSESEEEKSQDS